MILHFIDQFRGIFIEGLPVDAREGILVEGLRSGPHLQIDEGDRGEVDVDAGYMLELLAELLDHFIHRFALAVGL